MLTSCKGTTDNRSHIEEVQPNAQKTRWIKNHQPGMVVYLGPKVTYLLLYFEVMTISKVIAQQA